MENELTSDNQTVEQSFGFYSVSKVSRFREILAVLMSEGLSRSKLNVYG